MESIKLLAGAAAVYVVAACAGGAERAASRETGQAGAQASTGGASDAAEAGGAPGGETVTGAGMAGLAGLLEPVPVAHAAGASGVAGAVATGGNNQPTGGQATVCDCPPPYEPPEPEVVTVGCDVDVPDPTASSQTWHYAVAAFPGRSAEELVTVHVSLTYADDPGPILPAGFTDRIVLPIVRDGAVAANCGSTIAGVRSTRATSVTFVLP
jgi:hypothetical protein